MKRFLVLLVMLPIFSAGGVDAVTPKQLERIDQLKKEVVALFKDKKFEQAVPLLSEILAIDPLDKTASRYQAIAKQQVMEPFCKDAAEAFQNENYATAVLKATKEARAQTEVVVITAHGSVETAMGAMNLGALDYIYQAVQNG